VNATDQQLAARLRELNRDPRVIELATIANYTAIKPTELRWVDLDRRSQEDYRVGGRRFIEALAKIIEGTD
jgi:hypothetical protein